jgi:hypothetical protein
MGQRASGRAGIVVRTQIAVVVLMAWIYGCATEQPQPILTPVEVKVPVATPVYCKVAKLDQPQLPIAALKTDSAPDDTIRAYAATVAILKGAVRERDLAIAGCAAPVSDQPQASEPHEVAPSRAGEDVK